MGKYCQRLALLPKYRHEIDILCLYCSLATALIHISE